MAVYYESYSWYMSLTYEQWARSLDWLSKQIEANRKAGIFSNAQVLAIWARHDKLVQDKVDAAAVANPPKVVQSIQGTPGNPVSSMTAEEAAGGDDPNDWPLWKRAVGVLALGSKTVADSVTGTASSFVSGATEAVAEPVNKVVNYVLLGGLILIILKIFRR